MARSLGTLTIDLLLKAGAFETDSGRAARIAEKNAKAIARSFDAAGKAIGVALVAGVTTVSTAVGLAINRMDDMSKAAQRAQMPTEEFSKLAHAADLADVSMEDLTKSVGKLSKAQGDAAMGAKTQREAFDALGIAYKNADGTLRNTTDVFLDFADKFQKFQGSPEIMAAGMALFGRSFQNLIPLLKDGSAGLREAFDDAEKLGLVLSTTAGQQAEQFNDNLSRMKSLVGGVAVAFASQLLPELVQATDAIVEMVKEAGGAAEAMRKLGDGARVAWEVIKPLGVYVGTAYVSSMALAAVQSGALAAAMANVAAAGGVLTLTMNGLRVAAAFLFGPVGLIAAGATGLYLLATRETEADKAAKLHKQTLDEINGVMRVSAQRSAELAAQKRNEAIASLKAAEAVLIEAEARFKASEKYAYSTAGMGPGMGGASATSATMASGRLVAAQNMVAELRKEVDDLTKSVINSSVTAAFEFSEQGGLPKGLKLTEDRANKAAKAVKSLADTMRDWGREDEAAMRRQIEAEAAARDRWESMRAQLQGPMAQALFEHKKRMQDIAEAGKAAGASALEVEAALKAEERRFADLNPAVREHMAILEDLQRAGIYAFQSMADAMGDFVGRGFRGVKDMWSQIKNAFKRGVADIVSIMLNARFVQPMQNWLGQMLGMGQQGMGGLASGQSGLGAIMNNGFDRLLSGFTSLFSRGGVATNSIAQGVGSLLPDAVKAGAQMASQAGVGSTGGGLLGGAGAFAKAIPIIGWIMAGMQMNADLYNKGWAVGGQEMDILKAAGKGSLLGIPGFGPGAVGGIAGVLMVDKLLQGIGLSGKTASILSGSSIIAKLFGMKKPEIKAQGITGSYGFDGLTGQSYADIKQKGGWFRSDKKWTEYGTLDPSITQAFGAAAKTVSMAAQQLAAQAGIDISAQLSGVKVSIGKLQLSADSEEAKKQLEGVLNQMVETLSAKAVQAMGFGRLLDDGYAATEIMTGLSAALQLVTGETGKLERSLSALEVERVQLTVEWFEKFAASAGTTLAEGIQKAMGLLSDYSSLIGGVRQQLATYGLTQYQKAQLDVELAYRAQVKQANDLAKALGLSGARAEDLAAIEQLRALNMAELAKQYAAQNQQWLQDLGLSDLGTMTDSQKLAESMQLLQDAVNGGDLQRAQKLAEQALGLGRNLYASGSDYNALYDQVTGLVGDLSTASMEDLLGFTNAELASMADLIDGLPARIAQEMATVLITPSTPAPAPTPAPPQPAYITSAPPAAAPSSGTSNDAALAQIAANTAAAAVAAEETLRITKGMALKATA